LRHWIRHFAVIALLVTPVHGPARAQSPTTAPATKIRDVVVVFKTHFDIGYTDLSRNVCDMYATAMIDKALDVCEKNRHLPPDQQFVWTLPGWPLDYILNNPKQTPERRERVLAGLRDGHFVFHALPFTTHTESMELEDYVRGMRFSSDLAKSLGQPLPRDAKMTDVPSHVWSLPTILAHAGVQFLHLGVNRGSTTPDVPPLFWWEGPDGSRLLTMQSPQYGTGLVPPADWPHATWLALIHTSDNMGPPKPEDVEKLLAEAAEKLPGVKVRMGRLSDFAEAILKENPRLPVVRADMPDTWIHGLLASPIPTAMAREVRPRICAAEAMHTLLSGWDLPMMRPIEERVSLAYEQSLLYGEHTWGLNVKRFDPRLYGRAWQEARAKGTYARLEQSWATHHGYVDNLRSLVDPLLEGMGGRMMFENQDGVVRFVARNLPPLGYRTFKPGLPGALPGVLAADEATSTLENDRLRVRLDVQRGTIASLVDKRTGREFVDGSAEYGLGQYLYERFDTDQVRKFLTSYSGHHLQYPWTEGDFGKPGLPPASEVPYAAASPEGFKVRFSVGAVSASATMTAQANARVPHGVALTVTLYRGMSFVDVTWAIMDKKADSWPEAGWLCLPFKIEQPQFTLGRLGCVVDPSKDLVPASNHHMFYLNTGMTMTGPNGRGVGICPIDSPLVSLDRPGLWQFSRNFVPTRPIAFVNLFNNQWATNFVQWIEGSWSSRVRLWPVEREGLTADLIGPAWEARISSLAFMGVGPAGELPSARAGLDFSRAGLMVTAFGDNPDGPGVVLRLWEQAGSDEPCRVRFPDGCWPTRVQPVDLRGRPVGNPLPLEDGASLVPMVRFGPTSLLRDLPGQAGQR